MIERKDILSIPYLKKTTFTGSREGLRFRFAVVKQEPEKKEGEKKDILEVTAWEGPYAFDTVLEEQKIKREMDFSEEGIQKGMAGSKDQMVKPRCSKRQWHLIGNGRDRG